MPSIPQVIVSETRPADSVNGYILGEYNGYMALDQKFDITSNTGPIRGQWVTIVETTPLSPEVSLMLAEVRVYGGKCF